MAANIRSKRKVLGCALFGLGIAALLFVYFFVAAPGDNSESPVVSAVEQSRTAPSSPSAANDSVKSGDGAGEHSLSSMSHEDPVAENPEAEPDAVLKDEELERLSDVFENSVYPLFRNDFQLDIESRAAINALVASIPEGLSSEDLDRVYAMIERRLSTPEAEDVAFIITHLYRLEQEEARLMRERGPVTTMAGQLEAQEELSRLRDQWFGPELSEKLFSGTDDVQSRSGEIQADDLGDEKPPETLTDEQAELAELEGDWEERYQRFLAERQVIDNAGLDQAEKDQQIEALLRQHYAPEELEAARAFDQMRKEEEK